MVVVVDDVDVAFVVVWKYFAPLSIAGMKRLPVSIVFALFVVVAVVALCFVVSSFGEVAVTVVAAFVGCRVKSVRAKNVKSHSCADRSYPSSDEESGFRMERARWIRL